jgi:hypothetical protein
VQMTAQRTQARAETKERAETKVRTETHARADGHVVDKRAPARTTTQWTTRSGRRCGRPRSGSGLTRANHQYRTSARRR